jgi:hypothetical protein
MENIDALTASKLCRIRTALLPRTAWFYPRGWKIAAKPNSATDGVIISAAGKQTEFAANPEYSASAR